jgi:hypothetical protein
MEAIVWSHHFMLFRKPVVRTKLYISMWGKHWAHKPSLTLLLSIEVPVPCQESQKTCICVQVNTQIDLNQQCKNGGQIVKKKNYAHIFPLNIIPTEAYILKIQLRLCVGNVATVCFVFSWVSNLPLSIMLRLDFGTASAGWYVFFYSSFILIILSHRLYLPLFIFQVVSINLQVLLFSVIRVKNV